MNESGPHDGERDRDEVESTPTQPLDVAAVIRALDAADGPR
ncbi:hypothetical protein N1028_03965 [Herbiconiux sp. CPCC 203407]|uniref:Uncharacterized protein n=1 Tax=Herbiconiux oxytropis TaxID=2970915 RepID=A0AA42BSB1_9MICO|nr:hypothetical protein [Herbiconiux oxytropis]MCS5720628.1 hypothetical protein [Herbiconiux oxytropis]MCS5725045.1 hypothetical protein [Herbiconiux oxytropis]